MECPRFGRWPLASKGCSARISCLRGRSQVASNISVSMVRVPDIVVRQVAFAHRRSPERLALHLQETKGRGQSDDARCTHSCLTRSRVRHFRRRRSATPRENIRISYNGAGASIAPRRSMPKLWSTFALILAVALSPRTAVAQSFQGGVRGAVKDPGGVVPGAEVTLINQATSLRRAVTTNAAGEYVFAAVDPGTYTLRAALSGFKTVDRRDLPIGTQQFLVLDLTLEVGAIEESITVSGQSPLIETANASQGAVIDSALLESLPAAGRSAFLIGTTNPTVIPSGDAQFNRQQDQSNASLLSLGGGTRRGNNYTLDGVPITDITNRAVANPSIEALADVKVQVHTYDAEMGRTGGGVFNTTLRSGTNAFHGSTFFQTRPVWGQANNYFSGKAGRAKPDSVYYMPGGGLGGPIVRNKTFFWVASEDYHNVSTRSVSVTFPTAAERAGDFSALTNSSGQRVIIYDPLTRQPFPSNIIPASR